LHLAETLTDRIERIDVRVPSARVSLALSDPAGRLAQAQRDLQALARQWDSTLQRLKKFVEG
jgi:hypothetical protein